MTLWTYLAEALVAAAVFAGIGIATRRTWDRTTGRASDDRGRS
jgi:hypothetical protein